MRSPGSLGLGGQVPYVTPSDLVGAFIAIRSAALRTDRFGQQVVFTAELLADAFDANGNAIPAVFRFTQKASPAREEYVSAFSTSREPIGPFVVVQLPAQSSDVDGAIVLNDATGLIELPALGTAQVPAQTPAGRPGAPSYAPKGAGNGYSGRYPSPAQAMAGRRATEQPPIRPDEDDLDPTLPF